MANHPSALKRHRQSEKRRLRNRAVKTRLRHLDLSPELALRAACDRFITRARRTQSAASNEGHSLPDLPAEERERLWQAAKTPTE